jgi:hypothetical protein
MIKAYVEMKKNIEFQLASDGKSCILIAGENGNVTLPENLAEALLYHVNLAAGSKMKCLFDGKEPKNPLRDLAELEQIAATQEEAVETLRAENEALVTAAAEQNTRILELEVELESANEKILEAGNEISRHKRVPEHSEVPEPS